MRRDGRRTWTEQPDRASLQRLQNDATDEDFLNETSANVSEILVISKRHVDMINPAWLQRRPAQALDNTRRGTWHSDKSVDDSSMNPSRKNKEKKRSAATFRATLPADRRADGGRERRIRSAGDSQSSFTSFDPSGSRSET